MSARRLYVPVVLSLLALGGLAFFAASRTWIEATVRADGLPADPVHLSGTDAVPLVPALALVLVTGALAVLAASRRVRWLVGVLLVVVGLAATLLVATSGAALDDALGDAVRESGTFTGRNAPDGQRLVVWPVLAGVSFALAAALGVVVVRLASAWPTMGSRYERRAATNDEPRTEAELWAALDEGRDPTE